MLLDSCAALRQLHLRIGAFLDSSDHTLALPATTEGDPGPYERFLAGLRITKSDGAARLSLGRDSWLELFASVSDLRRFNAKVLVDQETDHHHWYCSPLSLIIEADSIWVSEHES